MKLYPYAPPQLSRAMARVSSALAEHVASPFEIVKSERMADVVVLHVIGWGGLEPLLEKLRARKQKFVIMQYCLTSTENSSTAAWLPIWQEALAVWSYYDLKAFMRAEGVEGDFNFYHAPLGADARIFQHEPSNEVYRAFSTGYVAESECLGEVADACAATGSMMAHIGGKCSRLQSPHVDSREGVSDALYCEMLRLSRYVTGLRRCEGFELPAAEGLLCGTRPVLFDAVHYRSWFGELAEYIPEASPEDVTKSLTELFSSEPRRVTAEERREAADRFNWSTLVSGFYRRMQ